MWCMVTFLHFNNMRLLTVLHVVQAMAPRKLPGRIPSTESGELYHYSTEYAVLLYNSKARHQRFTACLPQQSFLKPRLSARQNYLTPDTTNASKARHYRFTACLPQPSFLEPGLSARQNHPMPDTTNASQARQ